MPRSSGLAEPGPVPRTIAAGLDHCMDTPLWGVVKAHDILYPARYAPRPVGAGGASRRSPTRPHMDKLWVVPPCGLRGALLWGKLEGRLGGGIVRATQVACSPKTVPGKTRGGPLWNIRLCDAHGVGPGSRRSLW